MSVPYQACCKCDTVRHYSGDVQSRSLYLATCPLLSLVWCIKIVNRIYHNPLLGAYEWLGICRLATLNKVASLAITFEKTSAAATDNVITSHHPFQVSNSHSHVSCSSIDISQQFSYKVLRMKILWMASWPQKPQNYFTQKFVHIWYLSVHCIVHVMTVCCVLL